MPYKKKRIFVKWIGIFVNFLLIPRKYMANMERSIAQGFLMCSR
jgi:hypothetical protein